MSFLSRLFSRAREPKVALHVKSTPLPPGYKAAPPLPDGLFARDFDLIVCDSPGEQHGIAHFKRDVKIGDPYDPGVLFWYQPAPIIGTLDVPGCAICGAKWWLPGEHYHFKDGWR